MSVTTLAATAAALGLPIAELFAGGEAIVTPSPPPDAAILVVWADMTDDQRDLFVRIGREMLRKPPA